MLPLDVAAASWPAELDWRGFARAADRAAAGRNKWNELRDRAAPKG